MIQRWHKPVSNKYQTTVPEFSIQHFQSLLVSFSSLENWSYIADQLFSTVGSDDIRPNQNYLFQRKPVSKK